MSARTFRSFPSATPIKASVTEAQVLAVAQQLIDEHAVAREAATMAANSVCGGCKGAGTMPSTLMPGQTVKCWACDGTGQPNDKMVNLPELTAEDNNRLWKLHQLVVNYPKFRGALVALIRQTWPEMYADANSEKAAN